MDLEVLIVEESKTTTDSWHVLDVVGINTHAAINASKTLNASKNALILVHEYLDKGLTIFVPKNINTVEVTPTDLIITENDALTCKKNLALRILSNLLNLNLLGIDIIDAMDYLDCYMKLLAAGIFITNKNREDKYFEIIEAALENEMPNELPENSTFEQEQEYIEKKKLYETALENLNVLEKYLNAYDKLSKINFTNTFLHEIYDKISTAETDEEVDKLLEDYKILIDKYQIKI